MYRFKRILVGVDWEGSAAQESPGLSVADEEAVQTALSLGAQLSAEVTFVSIVDCVPENADEATEAAIDARIRSGLDQTLVALVDRAQQRGVAARACVCYGTVWLELIREVLRESYDMVIIGPREVDGQVLGNTALKLLRNCPCPVWVTKPRSQAEDFYVLVLSDLSELSTDVMHLSVTLGQLTDSKTRLMHVVEYPPIDPASSAGALEQESQAQLRNEAESALYEQLAGTDHRTLTYGVLPHIEDGSVDLAVLRAIDQFSIDLVVLGLSNRCGIPGQLGRTAEALLPRVSCGVLAIKDREFPSPVTL